MAATAVVGMEVEVGACLKRALFGMPRWLGGRGTGRGSWVQTKVTVSDTAKDLVNAAKATSTVKGTEAPTLVSLALVR